MFLDKHAISRNVSVASFLTRAGRSKHTQTRASPRSVQPGPQNTHSHERATGVCSRALMGAVAFYEQHEPRSYLLMVDFSIFSIAAFVVESNMLSHEAWSPTERP